jgi:CRP-like cAMP-binding protein
MPAATSATMLAQTVQGVGNSGMYATLDANASMDTLTTIERMMLLRNVPMFTGLEPEDLDEMASVVIERRYAPNEDLCRQGDHGDAVFVVVKGRVRVFTGGGALGPERLLSELEAGACIGEMAVLDDAPRSATVRALERTRVVVIPGAGFKELLSTRPQMARSIIGELVRRMRGMKAR